MRIPDKIMFEIYRDGDSRRIYRVVYFTELNERNREFEIHRAMAGEHFFDGYFTVVDKESAKSAIAELVSRLNKGESVTEVETRSALGAYLVD